MLTIYLAALSLFFPLSSLTVKKWGSSTEILQNREGGVIIEREWKNKKCE